MVLVITGEIMTNIEAPIFAVRHGEYDHMSYNSRSPLTLRGVEQSRMAGERIGEQQALIISSAAARALQTAEIIRQTMGVIEDVGESKLLEEAGNARHCVSDIDRLIKASLMEAGLVWNRDKPLVIVSHMPFVNSARANVGVDVADVAFGEVVEINMKTWTPSEKTAQNAFTEKVDDWVATIENGGSPWARPKPAPNFWEYD